MRRSVENVISGAASPVHPQRTVQSLQTLWRQRHYHSCDQDQPGSLSQHPRSSKATSATEKTLRNGLQIIGRASFSMYNQTEAIAGDTAGLATMSIIQNSRVEARFGLSITS